MRRCVRRTRTDRRGSTRSQDCAQRLGAIIATPPRDAETGRSTGPAPVRHLRHAGHVLDPSQIGLRLGPSQRRAPTRAHPHRHSAANRSAPNPTPGPAVHSRTDQNRTNCLRAQRTYGSKRDRPGMADIGVGWSIDAQPERSAAVTVTVTVASCTGPPIRYRSDLRRAHCISSRGVRRVRGGQDLLVGACQLGTTAGHLRGSVRPRRGP